NCSAPRARCRLRRIQRREIDTQVFAVRARAAKQAAGSQSVVVRSLVDELGSEGRHVREQIVRGILRGRPPAERIPSENSSGEVGTQCTATASSPAAEEAPIVVWRDVVGEFET